MTTNRIFASLVGLIAMGTATILTMGPGCGQPDQTDSPPAAGSANVGEYRITKPVQHENLTLYMIHGPDRVEGEDFITLQEALDANVVTVHETGQVSELTIENTGDRPIYVQAGEIVKGGKQDRTIQQDLVVPGKSGRIPLKSFCVEQGRWAKRGGESSGKFSSANEMLATNQLKLAALKRGNQRAVWREVARAQKALSTSAGTNVAANQSASSLQLAMENEELQELVASYVKSLEQTPQGKDRVVGLAIAVNGKVTSVDLYAAEALFRKIWPKLLRAAAYEAIAKQQKNRRFTPPAPGDVADFMALMNKAKVTEQRDLDENNEMLLRENSVGVSYDYENNGTLLHRSYIQQTPAPKLDSEERIVPPTNQRDLRQNNEMLLPENNAGIPYNYQSNGN
jgi:hypothetical protein